MSCGIFDNNMKTMTIVSVMVVDVCLLCFKAGHSWLPRCTSVDQSSISGRPLQVLHHCLPAMESLMTCLDMNWMAILVSNHITKRE